MSAQSRNDVVIVAAARTPQGKLNGKLSTFTAVDLGVAAVRGALERCEVTSEEVSAVIVGNVLPAGLGQNAARQVAIAAGIGWHAHASSVNKVCLSGLTAVISGARMLREGDAEVVVAAGMESMTNAPHLLPGSRSGWKYGAAQIVDHAAFDGLTDAFDEISMGLSADQANSAYGVSREEQDYVAYLSHKRAAQAWDDGIFSEETVSLETHKGEVISADEGIRRSTTPEKLAGLRPAFSNGGSITAGNSSQISDGASAVILATRERAEQSGWDILASVEASGQVAGPDNHLQAQPANAIDRALSKQKLTVADLDFVEINEAFGAVVVASQRKLQLSSDNVNVHGGAIALGHPIGASGNRLVAHAVHELVRRGCGTAAVALCGGGGQGEALLLQR